MAGKTGRGISEDDEMNAIKQISRVEGILQLIPAEIISRRAVECGSYARALFHWEEYFRQQRDMKAESNQPFSEKDELLQHLQMIYAHIDEPDCIEGISAHLKVLNPEQQIIEDRKAGRWTAAQSWYELALTERPNDVETQINLLTCLKESGQYGKGYTSILQRLADAESRFNSQLRRWLPCLQHTFEQYPTLRGRSCLVSGKVGTTRATFGCFQRCKLHCLSGLQCRCRSSTASTPS